MDGESTIILPAKNIKDSLLMIKYKAMVSISSSQEQNIKETGAVE